MKNKIKKLDKLRFKKSTISQLSSNKAIGGGIKPSFTTCQSWPWLGEPCYTDNRFC